jgi:hypothetical protein
MPRQSPQRRIRRAESCPYASGRVALCRFSESVLMRNKFPEAVAAMVLIAIAAYPILVRAADDAAAEKPRVVILCPECGMVYNIRRIEKPVAPERNLLPNTTSAAQGGGIGNETQALPLFSFGRGGAQRVQREPVTRSVWEVTVRYDNGQFGFVTHDLEPELKVGDRVRHVENTLEPIAPAAR